ncbi:hypothetical protein T265_05247 [Opisthorchis viverrini]|uniref:Uncharacterized protein n=1 Tax=Opisthorchis viverrini TaxID=6198 RepID=A0A074ZPM7_OPIVI|nr:hypothetical protein T265_05247 [Opisthorchis viverrini]KER27757.1 hypothetical protein T265_05247 [Opisthorchis viverrini]
MSPKPPGQEKILMVITLSGQKGNMAMRPNGNGFRFFRPILNELRDIIDEVSDPKPIVSRRSVH